MATATKLMTAEEFFEWANRPENRDRDFELERGEVVEVTKPGERHGFVCGNAAWVLGNYVRQRRKGYICTNDTGLILERGPDTVRGPDIVLYDETRRYNELDVKFTERMPALVVEVLSPNDRLGRMTRRVMRFLERGVRIVWLIDPDSRNVSVYRPNSPPVVVEEGEELTGEDVLPDLRVKVEELFALAGEWGSSLGRIEQTRVRPTGCDPGL